MESMSASQETEQKAKGEALRVKNQMKEKEEISEYIKELEEKQTEGEMKLIEEVERGRKAEKVADKMIAALKADNDDFLKKLDIAEMKVIESKARESNLVESGNKLMEELKRKEVEEELKIKEETKKHEDLKGDEESKVEIKEEIEKKKNTGNENQSKAAFLQCGTIPPPMMPKDLEKSSEEEYEEKIKIKVNEELLKTEESWKQKLFEKEDHFERDIEVLRRENKRIKEHLKEEKTIHH